MRAVRICALFYVLFSFFVRVTQAGNVVFDGQNFTTNNGAVLDGANLQLTQNQGAEVTSAFITQPFTITPTTNFIASFGFSMSNNGSQLTNEFFPLQGNGGSFTFVAGNFSAFGGNGANSLPSDGYGTFNNSDIVQVNFNPNQTNSEQPIESAGSTTISSSGFVETSVTEPFQLHSTTTYPTPDLVTGTVTVSYDSATDLLTETASDSAGAMVNFSDPTNFYEDVTSGAPAPSPLAYFGFGGGTTGPFYATFSQDEISDFSLAVGAGVVQPASLTWNNSGGTGDGVHWDTTNQNWNNGTAPSLYTDGANVTFSDSNNGNYAVTLNGSVSPNSVTFSNDKGNYVLSGAGGIAGTGSLTLSGSGKVTISTSNSYGGGTIVNSGELVIGSVAALPSGTSLTIGTGSSSGTIQLATTSKTFALSGLTIYSGSLDVTSNTVTISYSTGDPIATIQSYLAGGEIVSSTVNSLNSSQSKLAYGIGYADGADGIVSGLSSGEIEIKPTLAGDAKLQGNVVFGDFQLLAQYFGSSGGWDEGNFTYGATIDFGDFQQLAQDFGANSSAITASELASLNSFAGQFGDALVANTGGVGFSLVSVPEPASIGVVAMAGFGLLARRRDRRRARLANA
jgi:autotransporter-associated beta strand protein